MNWLKRQVCIICSAGGHFAEAIEATSLSDARRFYVTKNEAHITARLAGQHVYYVVDPHTSLVLYVKNLLQSINIYIRERPKVIVTTGAGIALAMCILGRLFGSKIIFIESGARVTTMSKTGRLLYRFAHVSYVQWKSLHEKYPKSVYVGRL